MWMKHLICQDEQFYKHIELQWITGGPRYSRTLICKFACSHMKNDLKLHFSSQKMGFISANSRFAVQNDGTYLLRITRETCTSYYPRVSLSLDLIWFHTCKHFEFFFFKRTEPQYPLKQTEKNAVSIKTNLFLLVAFSLWTGELLSYWNRFRNFRFDTSQYKFARK